MKTLLAAAGATTFFAGLIGLIVEYNHMEDLKNLVCPECGDGVFVATISEPGMVMCRDMGHWVGYPSDCKRLTIRAADAIEPRRSRKPLKLSKKPPRL